MFLWVFLFFCFFSPIRCDIESEIFDSYESPENDVFADYEFLENGKTDLAEKFDPLWKKNIFLTKEDRKLNIGSDIMPWKSTKDRSEQKKRRLLRYIISYYFENYIKGYKAGTTDISVEYPPGKPLPFFCERSR